MYLQVYLFMKKYIKDTTFEVVLYVIGTIKYFVKEITFDISIGYNNVFKKVLFWTKVLIHQISFVYD